MSEERTPLDGWSGIASGFPRGEPIHVRTPELALCGEQVVHPTEQPHPF